MCFVFSSAEECKCVFVDPVCFVFSSAGKCKSLNVYIFIDPVCFVFSIAEECKCIFVDPVNWCALCLALLRV